MTTKIKRHRFHSPEFKAQAVSLVAQGTQNISAIAKDLDISDSLLRTWAEKAGVKKPSTLPPVAQTQMMIAPHVVEALSPSALAKFNAGRPKQPKAIAKVESVSRDPAQLMVLLDLKPADLEPLQRIKMLANRAGMSTKDLVNALMDMAAVEGLKRKEGDT